ncbi:leucyl aminopeptidase family protein [Paenibacillus sp. WQ 127069]|uniref:Probable cytosol aminopeptidase n=1 Tax=Paenibacillus baimaensis TaxID=2982185 RepID=A0ABT2UBM1_9BACL|nr:leucyl aminopeptidase family protein [Paenibacillus sp. WQ 127069]MCU6792016.1 leucyl aminopeptidase family protein [Paenibacillus sp. WQ 127069]
MRITIDTVEPVQVLIYPVYHGESFPHRLSEGHKLAGNVTWLYGRSEGEADVLAAGLGERKKLTLEKVRRAGGASARTMLREIRSSATLILHAGAAGADSKAAAAEWLQAWVEGWLLGLYRFDKYRSATKTSGEVNLNLRLEDWMELSQAELEAVIDSARNRAEGTMLARDWVNESPETLNPDTFVDWLIDHFKDKPVGVHVYRGQELVDRGMNGLIAVGAGSKHAPALVELRYEGHTDLPLLALVGKAVTFDMGGMNVKTGRDISDARMDMGGAAAVIGGLDILVRQRAQVRVTALIAVADNLPDARAMLPSSVIRYPNGLTVQVANTDGEGRLLLADALIHAAKLGAVQTIDIATLTGNVGTALGLGIAGIWGDEDMTRSLVEIGERNGERLWPMPLMEEYEAELRSDYADLRNVGTSTLAGAITAALFIRRFVAAPMGWVHIDMAGTVQFKQDTGYSEAGATGYGARLLADYAVQYARKHEGGEQEVSL